MAPTAAAREAKSPTTTITGSFFCRVQKSQKDLGVETNAKASGGARNTSTRGRKLLTPEEPDVLRPHCEKCGFGEALRAGLDCRCHCPQCFSGKPRCSSPRMALRRAEGETCDTFTTKLALTRSRVAARSSQGNASASGQAKKCVSSVSVAVKSEAGKSKGGDSADSSVDCQKVSLVKDVPSRLKKTDSTKSSSTMCRTESRKSVSKRELTTESSPGKPSETAPQSTVDQPSNRVPCKRQKKRGSRPDSPSLCLSAENGSTKYRRPHCPMCSQLGCLRNIEVVCYCDACQESRDEQCSSPRMADFRKSHPGYASRFGKRESSN